jgi:hypothetical protein
MPCAHAALPRFVPLKHLLEYGWMPHNSGFVFWTLRVLHWEFLRLWTGFELPSSWRALPCYGADLNRNILDFMK